MGVPVSKVLRGQGNLARVLVSLAYLFLSLCA